MDEVLSTETVPLGNYSQSSDVKFSPYHIKACI